MKPFLINEFILYLKNEKSLAKTTQNAYKVDIQQYFDFYAKYHKEIQRPDQISPKLIKNYIRTLQKKYDSRTTNRKISAIKTFHAFLEMDGLTKENPAQEIKNIKEKEKVIRTINAEQTSKMIDSIDLKTVYNVRNLAMFLVLYGSGLRVSELIGLDLKSLHLNEGFLIVEGKGSKERTVPLTKKAVEALKTYIKDARNIILKERTLPALFVSRNGARITRQGFFKIVKTIAEDNEIDNVSPHTFRHSFATHLLESGCDLRVLQKIIGHESIQKTQIYTNISDKYKREKYNKTRPKLNNSEKS